MLTIHTLNLKKYATFDDVTFSIKPGVSYIYGLNRASGRASKNRNGVGKSALLGSIPEIIFEDPIVGEKSDRGQGHKVLEYKDSKGREIVIDRQPRGKGEKISVSIDGRDLEARTPTLARAAIRKLFPLTNEDYNTYVHIDSRVPHPLVMGTSAARQRFFTEFFNLNKIDAERKLYVAELNKLKRTRSAFDELRTQYDKTKENLLDEDQLKKYQRLEARYSKTVTELQGRISKVQNVLRLVEFASSTSEDIRALQGCLGEITVESFDAHEKDERINLKDAQEKLEDATAWEQWQRDNKKFTTAFSELSSKAKALLASKGIRGIRSAEAKLKDRVAEHQQKYGEAEKWVHTLKQRLLRDLPKKVEPIAEDRDELETLRRAYRHQLEHAKKFKSGTCETCGQIVKIKDPAVLQRRLEVVIEKLNRYEQRAKYEEAFKLRREDRREYEKWKSAKEEHGSAISEFSPRLKAYREILDLPPEPSKFKGQRLQVKVCEMMVEEIKDKLSMLKYMRPHLETVIEFLSLTKEQIRSAKEARDLEHEMSVAQDRWTRAKTALGVHETFKSQAADMRARLRAMKIELEDEEPLKHLVRAYQNNNLKKMAIEAISERLMVLVNRFAQQVFPERFSFEFKWDTKIQILAHRHYGKKTKTSDVRRLSGAESTFFTLVLVCALLAFVPDHKRVNVLILDEPAARLSDELRDTFKNLIRVLNTLIPSIIVITPHTEVYDGAHCWTVVKQPNGVSTIVAGHPQQVEKK